ncbi:MAG TPA: hypothetical protein VHS56_12065 [Candidatus Cybelea sp.]|nr:hypothetical protein [Candidatus Cybelea sp.]
MDEKSNRRAGVEDADATGMVAGEELITQAETMLPILKLHDALPEEHEAHAAIDQLDGELKKNAPDRAVIEGHVQRLRLFPELEAIVVNWWDDPRTQRFFADLGQIGV